MKWFLVMVLIMTLILLIGCGEGKVTGRVFVNLQKDVISDGEITSIELDGENTGNVKANIILKIIPEDDKKLLVSYQGSLEDILHPGETIGNKIVNIQGFTDHTSTDYWIKIQLINKNDNSIIDEKEITITVKK